MEPKDIENPIAEEDFRSQLRAEKQVLDLFAAIHRAYIAGYEQRVIDQLQGALDGNPVGSSYSADQLKELADKYVLKHCV